MKPRIEEQLTPFDVMFLESAHIDAQVLPVLKMRPLRNERWKRYGYPLYILAAAGWVFFLVRTVHQFFGTHP